MKKILLFILLSIAIVSCTNTPAPPEPVQVVITDSLHPVEYSTKLITLKEFKENELYMKNCRFCHGNQGQGDGVKARLDTTICPYDLSKEKRPDKEVYYVIVEGVDKMPNHKKLKDDDVWLLVVHIKKFK